MTDASSPAISRQSRRGMIVLRFTQDDPANCDAFAASGLPLPDQREIVAFSGGHVAWMSPDELLVLCDHAKVEDMRAGIAVALADRHHLVADVSDARASFEITGPDARLVLAKLCPVDLADGRVVPGVIRRTRMAQIAVAFWMTESTRFELICFQSVSVYAEKALKTAALDLSGIRLP